MEKSISFSFLPLLIIISFSICLTLLPNLIAARQINSNVAAAVTTDMIEKACQHASPKQECIDALKSIPDGNKPGLNGLAEVALKVAYNSSEETMDRLSDFIEHENEGGAHWKLLYSCAGKFYEARSDVKYAIEYLSASDYAKVTAKVNHAIGLIETCEEKIKGEPGHPHSLSLHNGSKVFRRLSKYALVITRLAVPRHYLF